jgi:hypothetical protein
LKIEDNIQFSICNIHLLSSGTGHGFGQQRVDLVQQFTFGAALREGFPVNALFTGAFYQIPDFEVIFIFEHFYCHFSKETTHIFWLSALQLRLAIFVP